MTAPDDAVREARALADWLMQRYPLPAPYRVTWEFVTEPVVADASGAGFGAFLAPTDPATRETRILVALGWITAEGLALGHALPSLAETVAHEWAHAHQWARGAMDYDEDEADAKALVWGWQAALAAVRAAERAATVAACVEAVEALDTVPAPSRYADGLADALAAIRALAAERDAARAEVARLREAVSTADAILRGGPTAGDAARSGVERMMAACDVLRAAAQEVHDGA